MFSIPGRCAIRTGLVGLAGDDPRIGDRYGAADTLDVLVARTRCRVPHGRLRYSLTAPPSRPLTNLRCATM